MKTKPCKYAGGTCFLPATNGDFCHLHAHEQSAYDARKAEAIRKRWEAHHEQHPYMGIYGTRKWREFQKNYIKRHPDCVRCGGPGTSVDHIVPHRGDEAMEYDESNLQTLCDRCHAAKSRGDR